MEYFHKTYNFLYTLNLSDGAIILYGIMRDRWELSLSNGWSDEEDKTYFYFSRKNIQEIRPRWGLRSISRFLKELLDANLLCAKYSSNGKDTKYYIMQIKPEILKAVMAKNTPCEFGNTPCEFGNTIRTIPISQTEQSDQKPDRHSTTTCAGEIAAQDDTTALNINVRDIPKKALSPNVPSEVLDTKPKSSKQEPSQEQKPSEQALSDKEPDLSKQEQSPNAQKMGEEFLATNQDTKETLSENLATPKVAKDILEKNQESKKEPSIKEILGIKETKSKECIALEPLTTNEGKEKKEGFLSIKELFKMAQKQDAKKQSKKAQEIKALKEESIFSGKSAAISEQTNLSSQQTSGVKNSTPTSKNEFIVSNGASFKKPEDLFAQDEQTTKEPLSDIEIMLQEFKEHVNKNWDEIISGNIHAKDDKFFSKSKNPLSDKFYFATKEQTNKTASPCVDKQNLVNSGVNISINNAKMNNEVNIFAQDEAKLKAHSSPEEHFSVQTIKDTGKEAFVQPDRSKKRLCANVEPINLPDFIDAELFANFIQHRKEIKKPLTPHARDLIIKKLSDFNSRGLDANKALENSIINGWQGVFEPRRDKFNYQKNSDLSNAAGVGALGLPLSAMSAWQQANTRKIQGF